MSRTRSIRAACLTARPWHIDSASASASNNSVKPLPSRAQGTGAWVVLPQREQFTRGTSTCNQASNWKKSRYRHERRIRPERLSGLRPPERTWLCHLA